MSFLGEFELPTVLLWIVLILCFGAYTLSKKRRFNLPPGPKGLPFVGIVPFLGDKPHLKLLKLSKKYGDVYSTYLGRSHTVVITDVEIAKQFLNKNASADRPPHMFPMMPNGVGFSEQNGPDWMEGRRYTIMEMKNLGLGTSKWEKLVQMEVSDILDEIKKSQGKPMNTRSLFSASISNNVMSLVSNRRLPTGHPDRHIVDHGIESFQRINGQTGVISNFPKLINLLAFLGLLKVKNELRDIRMMNKYVRYEIDEARKEKEGDSFINRFLREIEKNKEMNLGNTFTDRNLIGNVQALIVAGSDTTFVSLTWLLLAMASFHDVQDKVHEELDSVLGNDGSADWKDRKTLPYCTATIMEGQRWRTIAPLNLLHRANEDMVIKGYDVPKGTNLLFHLWAFHRDTKYWKDPEAFEPERFLSSDGKTVKENEAFMPFSYGKRLCIGKTVAYIELFHYFVGIMQKFRVLPESDAALLDLEGFSGLTLQPKSQPLRFIPR